MKISIYVRNKSINPSSYYRIIQYVDGTNEYRINSITSNWLYANSLKKNSTFLSVLIKVLLYIQMCCKVFFYLLYDIIFTPDIIIVQREIIPVHTPILILIMERIIYSKTSLVWDIDDDIVENKEVDKKEYSLLENKAKKIILSTNILKRIIFNENINKTIIIPTTDGDIFNQVTPSILEDRFSTYNVKIRLVWVGTIGNLKYIYKIIPILDNCASKLLSIGKQLELDIVTGKCAEINTSNLKINYVNWSRENTISSILSAHIGIMPLEDSIFTQGKAGFKLIQYMSAGLPVLGSSVGYNIEIINDGIGKLIKNEDEWIPAIISLSSNLEKYKKMSYNSKLDWVNNYSFEEQKSILINIFNSLKER